MVRLFSRVGPVAVFLSLAIIITQSTFGDVLITTSGSQWKGTIADEGTHYRLAFANRRNTALPKSAAPRCDQARADAGEDSRATNRLPSVADLAVRPVHAETSQESNHDEAD